MDWDVEARTDIGKVRERNEDAFYVDEEHGVFAVADGMGGRMGGDVASQIFVDTVEASAESLAQSASKGQLFKDSDRRDQVLQQLTSTVLEANREVYNTGDGEMGTTGDVLVLTTRAALLAHVGDSRVYLIRGDKIQRLTSDHTYAEEHLGKRTDAPDRDEAFSQESYDHVLTRSVGVAPHVRVDTLFVELHPGDRLLMCTDGLTNHLREREISTLGQELSLDNFADQLVERATNFGGIDNTTVLAIDVPGEPADGFDEVSSIETTEKVRVLREIEIFDGLDDRQMLQILRFVYQHDYSDGQKLIRQGARTGSLHIIVSGKVSVQRDGKEVATVESGDHVGEMALVDEGPRSADVVAVGDVRTLSIAPDDFEVMTSRSNLELGNAILRNMLRSSVKRLRNTTDILVYGEE